jgi:ubiquinone/menaquinone biosynthesis C-methylase UbiE
MSSSSPAADPDHVPETAFGKWFLRSGAWAVHVLERALNDLERLISPRAPSYPVILDVGCGWGRSFRLLQDRFSPRRMIGIDADSEMLAAAKAEADRHGLPVELHCADCARLPLGDGTVDMVFCHQTFHHLVSQREALSEFHRVLKPGGLLLFAESTRAYIHSWTIRYLFRHPMELQRDAAEYIDMIRAAGFQIDPGAVSYPYLWWSRKDLGLRERLLGIAPAKDHEETLVNLVAVRT